MSKLSGTVEEDRILFALAAVVCADPVLFNYPYDGRSTYVPEAKAAVVPSTYLYDSYYNSYPYVYRSGYPYYTPAAAPIVAADTYLFK
ncbi:hypothetical protein J6590_000887 [Homalodisca vitripennis]|nr:hypothetical protein J6590_000887 [Homalodisca vitripennis]